MMSLATFRWRPNPFFTALTALVLILSGFSFTFLAPLIGLPLLLVWAMLGMRLVTAFDYRLTFDDQALSMLQGKRVRWSIAWADLHDVRHEPGSLTSKNFDRLVLETESRTRHVTLNDKLFGRWSDPKAILLLLRERGYPV